MVTTLIRPISRLTASARTCEWSRTARIARFWRLKTVPTRLAMIAMPAEAPADRRHGTRSHAPTARPQTYIALSKRTCLNKSSGAYLFPSAGNANARVRGWHLAMSLTQMCLPPHVSWLSRDSTCPECAPCLSASTPKQAGRHHTRIVWLSIGNQIQWLRLSDSDSSYFGIISRIIRRKDLRLQCVLKPFRDRRY